MPPPVGAPRLSAAHHTPRRVPPEVRGDASIPEMLGPGRPGKVGLLELDFARTGALTELVHRYQKSPLQIMRPLRVDERRPGMAFVYLMSPGGGIVQADRLRMDFHCGEGTEVHLTTQAATKIHRMERGYATQMVNLTAGPGSYVEYLPDRIIPFRDSRFYQRTVATVDPEATLVLGESVTAGRAGYGEHHDYRVLALDLELRRPDGAPLALDTVRLCPGDHGVTGPAVLGPHDRMASLFVVTGRQPAGAVADAMDTALAAHHDLRYGVSVLPGECGAWARLLGGGAPAVGAATLAAWDAVRRLLTGGPAPDLRKL